MWWIIVGPKLPPLRIYADTFSEAISMACAINPNYCGGYVDE